MTEDTKASEQAEKKDTPAKAPAKTPAKAPAARKAPQKKPSKKVTDLISEDLVNQETGSPAPLSVTTDNLQVTVAGDLGRVLVKISNRGYIGEDPVVLLGSQIEEIREVLDELDKLADERLTK